MRPTENDDNVLLLALGGTTAIHIILIVLLDVLQVTVKEREREIAPKLEYVVVEVPKVKPPPPPEKVQARIDPPPRPDPKPRIRVREPEVLKEPPRPPPPPDQPNTNVDAPVVQMSEDQLFKDGTVLVKSGNQKNGRIGRETKRDDGKGKIEPAAPPGPVVAPVSVATIKKRAMPKGDHSYFDAGRDYPAAARQAGIEGVIRVKLVVSAQGKVTSAALLNKLGHGLDELALERARKIEFEPAKDTDDKSVASIVIWTFNMTLPK